MCSDIATLCLQEFSDEKESDCQPEVYLTEKDKECIQYLAGYCFRTLYTRIRSSRLWQSDHSQQCLSLLIAAKCDNNSVQSLVDVKNRGGLWKLNDKAQSIFIYCEKEFKIFTSDFQHTIDSKLLLCKILEDCSVNDNFKYICESADRKVNKEVAKNLLENLILLYIRVRSHSYAKKLKESHKVSKKTSKKRSLRTEIKLASSSTDYGH